MQTVSHVSKVLESVAVCFDFLVLFGWGKINLLGTVDIDRNSFVLRAEECQLFKL